MSKQTFAALVLIGLLAACSSATTSATLDRTPTPVFSDLITIKGVQVQHKSDVRFCGESALPDGTCILTQLYEDEQPLVWWPSDRCAQVKFGRWEIHVRLSDEQGSPGELSETEMYILRAWQKNDPAIEAQYFPFDLQGPPPESTLHTTIPSQTSSEPGKTPPGQEQGSDCSQVERLPPDSVEAQAIGQDLLVTIPDAADMENPPLFAEIRSIDRLGEWILFQASFESHLEPAIFVLQETPTGYIYVTLWGGQAHDTAEIRSALAAEVASLPPALLACLQPAEWFLPAPVAPTVKTPSLVPGQAWRSLQPAHLAAVGSSEFEYFIFFQSSEIFKISELFDCLRYISEKPNCRNRIFYRSSAQAVFLKPIVHSFAFSLWKNSAS